MELNLGELVKIKIQIKNSGNSNFERARVSWVFANGEIRGGRITLSVKNPSKLWVQLPKYKAGNGKYINIIRITDSEYEKFLEEATLDEYRKSLDDNQKEIDIDEIDF